MRSLRAAVKLLALTGWSALFLLPGAAAKLRRRRIERGARLTRAWAAGCLKILGGKVEVEGEALPEGGGLIVSNHLSYLDIMVQASVLKVRFAPKIEMRKWPLVGQLTGFSNPVWIDRKRRGRAGEAESAMLAALREDVPLLVYPEGTSGDGSMLMPFKSTCFSAAVKADAAIYPILLRYEKPSDGTSLPWFGNTALLPHIWRVMGLKEFRCRMYIMEKIRPGAVERKELAAGVRDTMASQYRRWKANA